MKEGTPIKEWAKLSCMRDWSKSYLSSSTAIKWVPEQGVEDDWKRDAEAELGFSLHDPTAGVL